jgi:DNA repair protein RadC
MNDKIKIRDMPLEERPRERLAKYGAEALSNAELLAIILRTGMKGDTAIDLANKLLNHFNGNLKAIVSADMNELSKIKGLGFAKSAQIKAAFELSKRINYLQDNIGISSPKDAAEFLMPKLRYLDKEYFFLLCLDTRNKLIDNEVKVSIGSLNASIVESREIFKAAISKNAASVILAHNHPSGDPTPSNEDIAVTKRVVNAGDIIGIKVNDHIIIGDGKYVSMKERGLI